MFVIAYDIPDDGRRARVAKTLEGYGDRLQYSVFVVIAGPAKLVRLQDRLENQILSKEDSIAVFDLGIHEKQRMSKLVTFIGVKREVTPADVIVL